MATQASFSSGALHGHDHTVSLLVQVDCDSQGTCCHGTRQGVKPGSRGLQLDSVAERGGPSAVGSYRLRISHNQILAQAVKKVQGISRPGPGKPHRKVPPHFQSVVPCTKIRDLKDMDIDCLQPWLWS